MLSLFDKLLRRGLISGIYPESAEYRAKLQQILSKPTTVYTGIDVTSSSLHIGNLATIINSLYFYGHGHQVICVIGDATARVGDPSGHTQDRKRIDKTVIAEDASSIETTLKNLFKNFKSCFLDTVASDSQSMRTEALKAPLIIRNSEWYQGKEVVDFVDDIFRDVRVGGLLHKKSIQERIKSQVGMNMAEFSYQIFQAYDWLELRRRYDCRLQIGGNDQQGNIYTGHDLIKKCLREVDSIGLLAPLITNSKGKKLGKTTSGITTTGIWLNPKQTSPYDLYQYFHRTPDADLARLLRVFTFYSESEIDEMIQTYLGNKADVWHCQRKLAEHACKLIHGDEGLRVAKSMTNSLFPPQNNKQVT